VLSADDITEEITEDACEAEAADGTDEIADVVFPHPDSSTATAMKTANLFFINDPPPQKAKLN